MCGLVPNCGEWELVSGFGARDSHYGGFSCGTWAQVLQGMRGLPGSRMEPMSPAVTGGFFTTQPPEKPGSFCACLWLKVISS